MGGVTRLSAARARLRPARAAVDLRRDDGLRRAYTEHGPELYRFALRQLGDVGAAQDAVQEVFLRAWRAAARFDPDVASLRVWLFAIARNVVVDEVRRRSVRRTVPADDAVLGRLLPPVDGPDTSTVTAWLVEEALRRLTPEHRAALVEVHLRGRPTAEVAAELAVPEGTLRSRLFYGLKALRLALDEMGVEP